MKYVFTDPDLIELDRIWPLGQRLEVQDNGTIVVAGAYEGRYMHYLSEMFPKAILFGYEPQLGAYLKAHQRLAGNRNVTIWQQGLSTSERQFPLVISKDGSSLLNPVGHVEIVNLKDVVSECGRLSSIDMFVMNIEGSEWSLIPYLLDEMMHHRIASIALQQHTKYASKERIARVKSYLAEYYDLIYSDGQLDGWEYWRRK